MEKEETVDEAIKLQLTLEKSLISSKWLPSMERDWPIVKKKLHHRHALIYPTQEDLEKIFKSVGKLNSIAINEWLKFFGTLGDLPGPYPNTYKGLAILYQLCKGAINTDIPLLPLSTYSRIYSKVWTKNFDLIEKWCDDWWAIFTTPDIRYLYSFINNPNNYKHITMFIDGKDFIKILSNLRQEKKYTKNRKSTLISRKNSWKNGFKVVFLDDCKGYPVSMSKVYGANEKYDGAIMTEMDVAKVMDPTRDTLIYDHHFDKAAKQMVKENVLKGFTESNICPNIKKKKKVDQLEDQLDFQHAHGGFRSFQETHRNAFLVNTFRFFHPKNQKKIMSFDDAYFQLKVCITLQAISMEAEKHVNLFDKFSFPWKNTRFNYPTKSIIPISINVCEQLTVMKKCEEAQALVIASMIVSNKTNSKFDEDDLETVHSEIDEDFFDELESDQREDEEEGTPLTPLKVHPKQKDSLFPALNQNTPPKIKNQLRYNNKRKRKTKPKLSSQKKRKFTK